MTLDLTQHPFFGHLPASLAQALAAQAELITVAVGQVLFYQGDAIQAGYFLSSGTYETAYDGVASPSQTHHGAPLFLDSIATLGGLVHSHKWTAKSECQVWQFPLAPLWDDPQVQAAARRYLAEQLTQSQAQYHALSAPVTYGPTSLGAEAPPGPFRFQQVTMIFAFCEANPAAIKSLLPNGLSLLQRPYKSAAPLLIALADFPYAQREDGSGGTFAYTETTFFIPVRYGTAVGFYVPMIYPSAYEPILLGREIYGFPKRLGETDFASKQVRLAVDGDPWLSLAWESGQGANEAELVGALGGWLGVEANLTSAAFQAGEVLRKLARLPAHRRVDVYNHKKIPAVDSTQSAPRYAVNQLTRATFGVLRWHQVTRLVGGQLTIPTTGIKLDLLQGLTLQTAYRTQLELRLGVGRVVMDYLAQ